MRVGERLLVLCRASPELSFETRLHTLTTCRRSIILIQIKCVNFLQVEANVGAPQVNYRESISRPSTVKYTHKKQSGGQGQFAEIEVRFEPLEPGSGYEFKSEIKGGSVPREYVPGVVKGLEECMSNGVLAGYPVVDVRAVLLDGSYHEVDSSVLAFQLAARGAFREGISKAAPKLLEPIMKVMFCSRSMPLYIKFGSLRLNSLPPSLCR